MKAEEERLKRLKKKQQGESGRASQGRATVCEDDPRQMQAEIDAWKAKLNKAADLQMFGLKR